MLASDSPDVIKLLGLNEKWAEREMDGDITHVQETKLRDIWSKSRSDLM